MVLGHFRSAAGCRFGRVLRPRGLPGCWIRNFGLKFAQIRPVGQNIEQTMSLIAVRGAAGAISRTPLRSKLLMTKTGCNPNTRGASASCREVCLCKVQYFLEMMVPPHRGVCAH